MVLVVVVLVLVVVIERDGSSFVGVGGHKYVCGGEEVEWGWFWFAKGPIKKEVDGHYS